MATRFIDKETGADTSTAIANDTTGTRKVQNLPDCVGFVFDNVDKRFKYNDAGTIRAVTPDWNPGIVSATASSLAVTASLHAGKTVVLNASGGVAVQLPLAAATGNTYRFVVGTASNATVVSAVVATDVFAGGYVQNDSGDSSAALADFMPTAATSNTYSPTTVGGGGTVGDWFEVQDIAANVWQWRGMNSSATDPTNRFSHV